MKITIIAIGKIKEKFLKDALLEYEKRLKKFCDIQIIEVSECVAKVENETNIKKVLDEEATLLNTILDKQGVKCINIALDINGIEISTIEFSNKIKKIISDGISNINFIIGSSYGLSDKIKKRVSYNLSFSKMTFPHQLFRVILMEQIYRVFKIINHEPYHK